jgi:CopG family nickel-responsive transcriptional regulator
MKASTKGVVRFSVSLPPSLVRDFDEAWKDIGYDNRSKAAHDAFRTFISEHKWTREEAEEFAGTIALIYYLDKPGLLNQIAGAQHKFGNIVTATMHVHLTKDKCLELIAVRGKANDIRSLGQELMTQKGVKELKMVIMAP